MPNKFKRNIPISIISITSLILYALGASAFSATTDIRLEPVSQEKVLTAETGAVFPTLSSFPAHEKLVFRVKWLGITAGELVAEIQGLGKWRGRKAYRIEVKARTVGFCSKLYKISDHYVSYLDAEKFYTLRHEVHRREGHYKKDAVTDFDQKAHKAYFKSLTDGSVKTYPIPERTQDTITASYYSRFLPLEPGRRFDLRVANSEQNYDLYLQVKSRLKRTIRGLSRDVYHFQPYARLKGKRVREGKVSGYITADKLREPVQVVIKAPIFTSLTATLILSER
jgi:hypothetical protein